MIYKKEVYLMANSKTDRRVSRTRREIMRAFMNLLEEKEFNKITIAELTEKADVNRRTFYLHFQDIFDLLEKLDNKLVDEFGEQLDQQSIKSIADFQNVVLIFLHEHANLTKVLLKNQDSQLLAKMMQIEIDFHFNHSVFKSEIERQYCREYIENGLKTILADWLDRNTMSLEEMSKFSLSLIESSLAIHTA